MTRAFAGSIVVVSAIGAAGNVIFLARLGRAGVDLVGYAIAVAPFLGLAALAWCFRRYVSPLIVTLVATMAAAAGTAMWLNDNPPGEWTPLAFVVLLVPAQFAACVAALLVGGGALAIAQRRDRRSDMTLRTVQPPASGPPRDLAGLARGRPDVSHLAGRCRTVAIVTAWLALATLVGTILSIDRRIGGTALLGLVAVWTATPYLLLLLGAHFAKRWSATGQLALYGVMLFYSGRVLLGVGLDWIG